MMSNHKHEIHDNYHTVAIALELLADMHRDDASLLCIECAQRHAGRLYKSALAI